MRINIRAVDILAVSRTQALHRKTTRSFRQRSTGCLPLIPLESLFNHNRCHISQDTKRFRRYSTRVLKAEARVDVGAERDAQQRAAASTIEKQANVKAKQSATSTSTCPLLTRDFIAKSLYGTFPTLGYFSTKDVINDLPAPFQFASMLGEMSYRMNVKQARPSVHV